MKPKAFTRVHAIAGVFFVIMAPAICAAEPALTSEEYLNQLSALSQSQQVEVRSRATTLGIPTGFSLPAKSGFVGLSLSNTRERIISDNADGSISAGFGVGNAQSAIGVEAILGITSIGDGTGDDFNPSDFGDSGVFGLKASRIVPSPFAGGTASVGLGATRIATWGDAEVLDPGFFAVASSTFLVPQGDGGALQGLVSIGAGTNIGTTEDEDGIFLGAGLGVTEWLALGGSFYGNELVAGATAFVPVSDKLDLQFGLSFGDITRENSDGRAILSVALIGSNLF